MSHEAYTAAKANNKRILALSPKIDYGEKYDKVVYYNCNPPWDPLGLYEKTGIVYHACEWDRNYLNETQSKNLGSLLKENVGDIEFCFMKEMLDSEEIMGHSNSILFPFYRQYVKPEGEVALLGFTNNDLLKGDLYDRQLNNWNINSDWKLDKKYDTIISLRCPYFAKKPEDFIERCYNNLNENGKLYVDWGLGDHWRFEKYKVGWVKDNEQEYAYGDNNYLWSTIWDDSFLEDEQFKLFSNRVKKFDYNDVKKAIYKETPQTLELKIIKKYFDLSYNMIALWEDRPQLYILISGVKRS